jgi:hypothetical protein
LPSTTTANQHSDNSEQQQEHKMSEQMFTAISIDSDDDYSTLLASNVTLAAAQAAAQADDDDWRINGEISEPRALEWRTTANGFEAVGIDTLRYVLTPYNAELDAIQQDQQLDGDENSDAIFYVLISEADGEQMTFDGTFATAELARAHAATLISDTYGSDAKPLTWHSFDGGYEAEFSDDDGAWRFIVLWHFIAAITKLIS